MDSLTIEMDRKIENVRNQHKDLNKAFHHHFYIEALYMEYMLMEEYTEMFLQYADLWPAYLKKRRGHETVLASKIRYIQAAALDGNKVLNKYFSDDLLDKVSAWTAKRYKLIQSSLKSPVAAEYLEQVAAEGRELSLQMRTRFTVVKKCLTVG